MDYKKYIDDLIELERFSTFSNEIIERWIERIKYVILANINISHSKTTCPCMRESIYPDEEECPIWPHWDIITHDDDDDDWDDKRVFCDRHCDRSTLYKIIVDGLTEHRYVNYLTQQLETLL